MSAPGTALEDDAPPPYTPYGVVSPGQAVGPAAGHNALFHPTVDEEGSSSLSSIPSYDDVGLDRPPLPSHLAQAAHGPSTGDDDNDLHVRAVHLLIVYPQSQARDYRRVPRCLRPSASATATATAPPSSPRPHLPTDHHIPSSEWRQFLDALFPAHLAPAAAQDTLPRHLRAQIARDRKDCPQEDDADRLARLHAVVAHWNAAYFLPRARRIELEYVPRNSPALPPELALCPNCYPAASRRPLSRVRSTAAVGPAGAAVSSPADEKRALPSRSNSTTSLPSSMSPSALSLRDASASTSNANPFNLGTRIREFALQITEQAQHCSQRISAQAIVHGKWAEEQARAYGQLIERRTRGARPRGTAGASVQEWRLRKSSFFEDMWDKYKCPPALRVGRSASLRSNVAVGGGRSRACGGRGADDTPAAVAGVGSSRPLQRHFTGGSDVSLVSDAGGSEPRRSLGSRTLSSSMSMS
ncbi:hypothetical protein KEM52_004645 [Ascosphaera acerosa]|nr:hypothetical protein KEM52_004645 [Ascosphaera acerosa]